MTSAETKRARTAPIVVLGLLIGALAGAAAIVALRAPHAAAGMTPPSSQQDVSVGSVSAPAVPSSPWEYQSTTDALGRGMKTACTPATVPVRYYASDHADSARLCLQWRQGHGTAAFIELQGGAQFAACFGDFGCTVDARVGDTLTRYAADANAVDGSSATLFILRTPKLIAALKGARRASFEVNVFNSGTQDLTFDVNGLDTSRLTG